MEQESGLYRQQYEHDACGIGAIISIRGERTRRTVDDALKIVEKLEHRAGKDATGEIGDGVGLMLQVPHRLFLRTMAEQGVALGEERDYGVGMFFFPQNTLLRSRAKKMFEIICQKGGLDFLAGGRCRRHRRCWATGPGTACPPSSSASSAARRRQNGDWILTGNSISSAGNLSSPTIKPTSAPCPAAPLSTRACSW